MARELPVLLGLLAIAGCASSGAVPRPFPASGASPASPAAPAFGTAIAVTALALRGVPYKNGGTDRSGFDCSGLVWYVFAQHGLELPRTVSEQYHSGSRVDAKQLQLGDLVFFRTSGAGPTHVGIMIGNEEFVHAPSSKGEVRVERIGAAYWRKRLVGARRLDVAGNAFPVRTDGSAL